jgi:hypothetical protein
MERTRSACHKATWFPAADWRMGETEIGRTIWRIESLGYSGGNFTEFPLTFIDCLLVQTGDWVAVTQLMRDTFPKAKKTKFKGNSNINKCENHQKFT